MEKTTLETEEVEALEAVESTAVYQETEVLETMEVLEEDQDQTLCQQVDQQMTVQV